MQLLKLPDAGVRLAYEEEVYQEKLYNLSFSMILNRKENNI